MFIVSSEQTVNVAHIRRDTGKVQSLEQHLRGTADLSGAFASKINLLKTGRLLGLLHDLGKASENFNQYLSDEDSGFKRGDIDHSTAGAQYLFFREMVPSEDASLNIMASEMIELAIASHHSGLIDCVSPEGKNTYAERMGKDSVLTHYKECVDRIDGSILQDIEEIRIDAIKELENLIRNIISDSKSLQDGGVMRLGLLNRLLLSCLIDADRIDTSSFQNGIPTPERKTDWPRLNEKLNEYLDSFPNSDKISDIRKRISEECLKESERDRGVSTLSVPTGGGKTLSGFRFAINHLIKHDMDRILFVVPYLTIIEQNASVIREALDIQPDDGCVIECHSNVDVGGNEQDSNDYLDFGTDTWDGPIIFTSMVQFLEVLFSSGTKRVRRMHNLSNSIIIFDEIQSLPIKATFMFNEAITFLTKYCGSSVILCTATQPLLGGDLTYRLELPPSSEIVHDVGGLSKSLRRTRISYVNPSGKAWNAQNLADKALDLLDTVNSVLVIVNTKSMARSVYESLKTNSHGGAIFYHLSTNMCPVHRKKILGEVVESLGTQKLVCVSTQLIEAGVDVDFDVVIRSMAGLDSIAQAAGRCNRHAKRDVGDVFVVRTDENLGPLIDIDEGRKCAEIVLRRYPEDPISPRAISEYFDTYFYKRSIDMTYRTDNPESSLFDMLSSNCAAVRTFRERNNNDYPKVMMKQAFMTANRKFNVIESCGSVIVPYDSRARNYISLLCSCKSPSIEVMRILQHYSVNTFSLNRMLEAGIARELVEGKPIFCLVDGYYSEELGICQSPNMDTIIF